MNYCFDCDNELPDDCSGNYCPTCQERRDEDGPSDSTVLMTCSRYPVRYELDMRDAGREHLVA